MRVHEFEGAMFEDEIEYYVHYMGWWKEREFFDEVEKMFCVFDV